MKCTIKVCNLRTMKDVSNVREAVAFNEGVVACQIEKEKGEVYVVYDNYFVSEEKIVQTIEDKGYTVI